MPLGTQLTEKERGRIDGLKESGKSNRQIAMAIGRSRSCVNNYVRAAGAYGKTKRSGRPPKLKKRDKRRIVRAASNNAVSSREIAALLDNKVCARRVRQVLKDSKVIEDAQMSTAPRLTPSHQEARRLWARTHMNTDWEKVCQFCLLLILYFAV